ncbi:hypothetical protein [Terricaulis sp.]|uniref:hypothetical protein n=1 Tax=Terricaulis sp. TaxID=2768686 RepID=UPI002AC7E0FF|nr:hypothetical protein [Terricaulis sp.]MDZ4690457.1 hypothetical protein [Terricaulis sp.]
MKTLLAAAAAILITTGAAAAEEAQTPPTLWYQAPIESGCTVAVVEPMRTPSEWTGACTPGSPISGEGDFRLRFEESGRLLVMRATFVDGAPDGPAVIRVYSLATDEQIEEHRITFVRGCVQGRPDCTPLPAR